MLRTVLAALLVLLLIPAVAAANASTWATRTVLDEEAFTATVGRTMDAPTLEAAVADAVADVLTVRIEALDPQIRQAGAQALGLSATAGATEIRAWLDARLLAALRSPEVEAERDAIVHALHGSLVGVATGTGQQVRIVGESLVVDLGGIIDRVVVRLDPSGRAARYLSGGQGDGEIVVAQASELATVQQAVTALQAIQVIVPLVVIAAILLVLLLAHRRARALGIVGVAVVVAGAITLAIAWGGALVAGGIPDQPLAGDIVEDVYAALTTILAQQSLLLIAIGALLVVVSVLARVTRRVVR